MNDLQLAGALLSALVAVGGLVVTLLRLQQGINEQFTRSRKEDEGRVVTIHNRIDALGDKIDQTYVRKDFHQEQISNLKADMARLQSAAGCPVVRGEP